MRILVACEFSGVVRDAFSKLGHDAWSCDLLPSERSGNHYQCDVREVLGFGWDLMISHPDCTYLTCAAEWAYKTKGHHIKVKPGTLLGDGRLRARADAVEFVKELWNAPVKRKCIENPIGVLSTQFMKPSQIIQPYEYGHNASKKTALWLANLPLLTPTLFIPPRLSKGKDKTNYSLRWENQTDSGQNRNPPSEQRWKDRARTYQGVADAMAAQWGGFL